VTRHDRHCSARLMAALRRTRDYGNMRVDPRIKERVAAWGKRCSLLGRLWHGGVMIRAGLGGVWLEVIAFVEKMVFES
jgi:hypothetical protein